MIKKKHTPLTADEVSAIAEKMRKDSIKYERHKSIEIEINYEEHCELIRFIENIRDNWDCDEDAHKHNTFCRCCEAQKLLKKYKYEK